MFFKVQAFHSRSQNTLNPTVTDMILGILSVFSSIAAQSREYPFWIVIGFIVFTQCQQGYFRQRHCPVESPLASVNMHKFPVRKDIFDLKFRCFPCAVLQCSSRIHSDSKALIHRLKKRGTPLRLISQADIVFVQTKNYHQRGETSYDTRCASIQV